MVDMTDYESNWAGANEVDNLPMMSSGLIDSLRPESWPQSNTMAENNVIEELRKNAVNKTHAEIIAERAAAAEAEAEDDEDEDEGDDDDEYGDEEAEDEEDEDDEEEEDEGEPPVPADIIGGDKYDDRYFKHNEKLRERFNEVEIDGFMKLLNMRPKRQW